MRELKSRVKLRDDWLKKKREKVRKREINKSWRHIV